MEKISLSARIDSFSRLGEMLRERLRGDGTFEELELFESVVRRAKHENGWFEDYAVKQAIEEIASWLTVDTLTAWVNEYDLQDGEPKTVGVIMAGNIPLVGFYDLLCVLISGNKLTAKLSSKDTVLMNYVAQFLREDLPAWADYIEFTDGLMKDVDAMIATGSNNSSRYFDYYFGKYPHIIRKNRTSVAVLNGSETDEKLKQLGADFFTYFGLGCRNVSRVFLPMGFKMDALFESIVDYSYVGNNKKYFNNYEYNKTLYLLNSEQMLDNNFVVLRERDELKTPVGVIHYSFYSDLSEVESFIKENESEIQVVVGEMGLPFGEAQKPTLNDAPDNVDVLSFLTNL